MFEKIWDKEYYFIIPYSISNDFHSHVEPHALHALHARVTYRSSWRYHRNQPAGLLLQDLGDQVWLGVAAPCVWSGQCPRQRRLQPQHSLLSDQYELPTTHPRCMYRFQLSAFVLPSTCFHSLSSFSVHLLIHEPVKRMFKSLMGSPAHHFLFFILIDCPFAKSNLLCPSLFDMQLAIN